MTQPRPALPLQVLDALQRGQVLEAIKLMRQQQGLGLKEAKDMVEAARRQLSSAHASSQATSHAPSQATAPATAAHQPATPRQPAPGTLAPTLLPPDGRAPGEEPPHSHTVDAVLLLAAALALCWYFWRY